MPYEVTAGFMQDYGSGLHICFMSGIHLIHTHTISGMSQPLRHYLLLSKDFHTLVCSQNGLVTAVSWAHPLNCRSTFNPESVASSECCRFPSLKVHCNKMLGYISSRQRGSNDPIKWLSPRHQPLNCQKCSQLCCKNESNIQNNQQGKFTPVQKGALASWKSWAKHIEWEVFWGFIF